MAENAQVRIYVICLHRISCVQPQGAITSVTIDQFVTAIHVHSKCLTFPHAAFLTVTAAAVNDTYTNNSVKHTTV